MPNVRPQRCMCYFGKVTSLVAVLTCFIANYITTFDQEVIILTPPCPGLVTDLVLKVNRIWKSKQNAMTVLFYLVRYIPPLCTGSVDRLFLRERRILT
jgi:hypothetical protein